MTIYARVSEETIGESLMQSGLLDVLGMLAMELTEAQIKRIVDDQYSGSVMHDEIPNFLRVLADEISKGAEE